MGGDLGDMVVTYRRIRGRIGAQCRIFGRWDRDLDHRSEPGGKHFRCWVSVVGSVCEEQINRTVDLIQETWQRRRIADIIFGEVRADDLATNKIKTEVELAPGAPFAFGFVFLLKLFALAEDLQACTVHHQMDPSLIVGPWLCLQRQTITSA